MLDQVSRKNIQLSALLDAPWKIAVICTVASLVGTYILVSFFAGFVPYYVPFVVIACAFPSAYATSSFVARYQQTIQEQNQQLLQITAEQTQTLNRLNARNQELEQLAEELQASNDELDAFARTVAHDLKNPLTSVVSYQEMLVRYAAQMPPEKLVEIAHKARRAGYKTIRIVDSLLLLASVRQHDPVQRKPLPMERILQEVQHRLDSLIREYEAQIELPAEWPIAHGHAQWVEEVWSNYLSNGIKYGGRPPRLQLGAEEQANGMIRFWVTDNGDGIAAADQAKLFTEFTRLNGHNVEGHGLGLSIAKRIIEKLGGEVGVESANGHGSCFYFTLPAAKNPYDSKACATPNHTS